MNRVLIWFATLSVWHRMAILVTALLIPIAVLATFVINIELEKVAVLRDEVEGLELIAPMAHMSRVIAEHRRADSRLLFLVFDHGERAAALKIHGFPQSLSGLKALDEMPPAPSPLDECVSEALVENGSAWLEFDHVRLFEAFSARLANSGNASVR